MLSVFTTLFNLVLESGFIPKSWTCGFFKPIYKNKGSVADANNYRGITILSCLGKLFTSVLNNRLNEYLDSMNMIGEEQVGFKKGYSTLDHIIVFKTLIDIYLSKGNYSKAFDTINRPALWSKLINHNINGRVLNVIYNMCTKAKS